MTTFDPRAALLELPLKEMDGTLLTLALLAHTEDSARLRLAVETAGLLHRGATRDQRGVMPRDHYVTHPLRNTLRLVRWGISDEDVLVASVLHDTVEDAAEEILTRAGLAVPAQHTERVESVLAAVVEPLFGGHVAGILRAVTNPETDRSLSRAARHEAYRAHVLDVVQADTDVLLVKLSDLVDNAGSLHHNVLSAPGMVKTLAAKYGPLLEPLRNEVARAHVFTPEVESDVLNQLVRIEARLEVLA